MLSSLHTDRVGKRAKLESAKTTCGDATRRPVCKKTSNVPFSREGCGMAMRCYYSRALRNTPEVTTAYIVKSLMRVR